MKSSPLQTKRRPAKGRFRLLHARTARRKQRVAATAHSAELEDDGPNLGVARALVVILLIHIVAIAGIFVHNRFFDQGAATAAAEKPKPAAPEATEVLPMIGAGDEPYVVTTGDTYAKIAQARGVAEEDLRRVNDNIPLRAGRILKMPGRRVVALEPERMERIRAENASSRDRGLIEEANLAAAATAVLVRPNIDPAVLASAPRATVVEPAPTAAETHTVASGDTFWSIANRYGISTDRLMQANGINDPKKLKIGVSLKIPAR